MYNLKGLYTEQERNDILRAAKAYDEACEDQIKKEQQSAARYSDIHDEIKAILYPTPEEKRREIMDDIRFIQDEIAELVRVRDAFFKEDFTREYANMLIRVWTYKIEDLQELLCK